MKNVLNKYISLW